MADLKVLTNGMSLEDIGEALRKRHDYSLSIAGREILNIPRNVVILGASIMEDWMENGSARTEFMDTANAYGDIAGELTSYAVGGDDSAALLTRIPQLLTDKAGSEAFTDVIIHIGGNDVTSNGPYPGGATDLDTNIRSAIDTLETAGFRVFLSTITYRTPPASNPSWPYNENVIVPIIKEKLPHAMAFNGHPIFDLYMNTVLYNKENQTDGVHYNSAGDLVIAKHLGEGYRKLYTASGNAVVDDFDTALIGFGGFVSGHDESFLTNIGSNESSATVLLANGSVADLSIATTGFGHDRNTSGRDDFGGTGYDILSQEVTETSIYVPHPDGSHYVSGDRGIITFGGAALKDGETYDVTILSSRSQSDGKRAGTYTIGTESVVIDGADNGSPTAHTGTLRVTGLELRTHGLEITLPVGASSSWFAYVNGILIEKVI